MYYFSRLVFYCSYMLLQTEVSCVSILTFFFPWIYPFLLLCLSIFMFSLFIIFDLFQPKTDLFSTRALIWVHFKTVRYFSQPIFSLFSYLKNTLHNLDIEMCSAPFFQKYCTGIYFLHTQFCSYWIIDFLQKCKKIFYCSRELSLFRLNKYYSLCRKGYIQKNIFIINQNRFVLNLEF